MAHTGRFTIDFEELSSSIMARSGLAGSQLPHSFSILLCRSSEFIHHVETFAMWTLMFLDHSIVVDHAAPGICRPMYLVAPYMT
jgi:hypothetical protein